MASVIENVRAKLKRRLSHKDQNINFDEHDEADEETATYLNKELETAETDDSNPLGKPGSLLNRLIVHGNKKTEEQIAKESAEAQALRQKINTQ